MSFKQRYSLPFLLIISFVLMVSFGCSSDDAPVPYSPSTPTVPVEPEDSVLPPDDLALVGDYLGMSSCKHYDYDKQDDYEDWKCLAWYHAPDGILTLTHINCVLDCAPIFETSTSVQGGVIHIQITEWFSYAQCGSCEYDLTYEIPGVPPAMYEVVITKDFVTPDHLSHHYEMMTATIDLSSLPSDIVCESAVRVFQ